MTNVHEEMGTKSTRIKHDKNKCVINAYEQRKERKGWVELLNVFLWEKVRSPDDDMEATDYSWGRK